MSLRRLARVMLGLGLAAGLTVAAPNSSAVADPAGRSGLGSGFFATTTHAIPGPDVFPEGVAVDPRTGDFFVGSTTDGAIYRGERGNEEMELFLPGGEDGRTTAVGLEVDRQGRLYVSGGGTGQMWVYDVGSGDLIRRFDTGRPTGSFINDVALDRHGNAYFTDSQFPVLWTVPADDLRGGAGVGTPEEFVNFTGTPAEYQPGFNLNGIVPTEHGRALLAVASNTGKLFRIGVADGAVTEVPVEGGELTAGDGMFLIGGRILLVVRNSLERVATAILGHGQATVVNEYTDEAFMFPTTAERLGHRLLVVNAQFDQRGGNPVLPFTVASVPLVKVLLG